MNTTFEVGQIVVLQRSTAYPEYNGWLGIVVKEGRECWATNTITMEREWAYSYVVRLLIDGPDTLGFEHRFNCRPWQLRALGDVCESLETEKAEELEPTI